MSNLDRFFNVCEVCNNRNLEVVYVDLVNDSGESIKFIPFLKCSDCEELLVANGILDLLGEINGKCKFPISLYESNLKKLNKEDRKLESEYLHSWQMIQCDGRENWKLPVLDN